jgi:hypothetical protein
MEKNVFSWRFMTPLYIGSALNPIDSSMIAVALPILPLRCVFNRNDDHSGQCALSRNQIALYTQVESEQTGTASGLLRTSTYIGYIGSIASSAVIAIGFHQDASVHGLHLIALDDSCDEHLGTGNHSV